MADVEKVISVLLDEKIWETLTGIDGVPSFAMDAVVLLKSQQAEIKEKDETIAELERCSVARIAEQQAEIERLKAQKQKWLQNIADQQLAVSPTGYETEEGLAKRTGEWNGLQMAWEILTEGR